MFTYAIIQCPHLILMAMVNNSELNCVQCTVPIHRLRAVLNRQRISITLSSQLWQRCVVATAM